MTVCRPGRRSLLARLSPVDAASRPGSVLAGHKICDEPVDQTPALADIAILLQRHSPSFVPQPRPLRICPSVWTDPDRCTQEIVVFQHPGGLHVVGLKSSAEVERECVLAMKTVDVVQPPDSKATCQDEQRPRHYLRARRSALGD